jgi:hypothetical protein
MKGKNIMFARRLCFSLLLLALMGAVVSAQSRRPNWSSKKGGARTQSQAPGKSDDPDDKNRVEGTWRATGAFDFGEDVVLFTFGAGKNANSGITVHSDNFFFVPSPSCLPAHGVWKRTGERSFIGTDEGFCFDSTSNFDPAGKIKFRYSVNLNKPGVEFDGNLTVEGYDVFDNLVFSANATLHGTRMVAEGP